MNAPRFEPHRTRPTPPVWPATRQPEPPAAPRTHDTSGDGKKDDDHAHEEPGYGHGV